ncbi:hypothetical protein HUG17_9356 [Dermatophagoides farinae]|uniref:BTB domain-containing protein n=1 Tax=Dermatophagoides farinae TaxID=6954 RepID=A0A9D4NS27_DERFA|nr:hypothetical protein HUG17_9356 [Dermatophagoides farinae]
MVRSSTENIDIELFKDDFEKIDQEFLQSFISIFSFFTFKEKNLKKQFLLMTKEATYAYGKEICSWLSLEHDWTKPQRIWCKNGVKIVQVDSGHGFVAILTDDGRVYLASNDSNWKTNNTFRLINTGNDRFKMIACGWHHLLLLRQDGLVFTMGDNHWSQITGDEKSPYESMIHIDNLENVKLIVGGGLHSLSMTNKGEIYSWGSNGWGQLGLGDEEDRGIQCLVAFPIANSIDIHIKDIVAGKYHSLFLFENGQLWGCGSNSDGQLGLGDDIKRSKPTKIPIENVQKLHVQNSTVFHWHTVGPGIMHGASKCYLKSASEYYRLMFSGNWIEKNQVIINDYSYETYYAYLLMLHTGKIYIIRQNITELVDLANRYGNERLMEYCESFIRNDLDEQTMPTYLPLIKKYEMKKLHDKLTHLIIEQVLPKITDNLLQNNEKSIEFLNRFYDQQ